MSLLVLRKYSALSAVFICSVCFALTLCVAPAGAAVSSGTVAISNDGDDFADCDPEADWYWEDDACEEPAEDDSDYWTSPGDVPPGDDWDPPVEPEPDPTKYWPAPPRGAVAKLRANGRTAVVPKSAPRSVKRMIKAANSLTKKPYKWGGGHSSWKSRGYDCSGATSYVLRAAGLVSWPMVSGSLAKWGKRGKGRWVQIYANKGHVFIVIAGLRFDTSGLGERGPRWRTEPRSTRGFRLRHPARL